MSNLPSKAEDLYNMLKPLQEAKGYQFNADHDMTLDLLDALLETRAHYGYMTCPCRLANGTREDDKDIICPCVYREEDVKEFGSCYCSLYVSKEWNEGKIAHRSVPERRPAEKIKF